MKNSIYNNYNILVYDIKVKNNSYYFYYNDELYSFDLVVNDIKSIEEAYQYAIKYNLDCFRIIKNNKGELFSKINDKYYALLKIKGILKYEYNELSFYYYGVNKKGNNWSNMWSDRLDYYELQIKELGLKHQLLLNTFGLYHGIAENAILYYNLSISKFNESSNVCIMHNRIKYPCYLIDYNNPLNFIIDYSVRDIAEYIKSYMLVEKYTIDNVINIINNYNFSNLMFNLFYSRLLYPSFYFDIFDKIILNNEKDDEILNVVKYSNRYLSMLKKLYEIYNTKYNMFKIEWLDKIKM